MDLLKKFQANIREEGLFAPGDKLLLAVSGGVDSVVLTELCHQAGYSFVLVHCNFMLRGQESERDEAFVRDLSIKYGIPIYLRKFDTKEYAAKNGLSIQEAARELRYGWFRDLLEVEWPAARGKAELFLGDPFSGRGGEKPSITHEPHAKPVQNNKEKASELYVPAGTNDHRPQYLLTAHHADDNIETLLMNFFKGTGITGLHGILPKQGPIVRPLLPFRKSELLEYAASRHLSWVEDSSNILDKYSRNFLRNQVIPMLVQIYPGVEENLLNNIARFRDAEILYQQAIRQHQKKLFEYKGEEIHIPLLKLKKSEPLRSILFELTKDYGFHAAQLTSLLQLLDAPTGKYVSSATHRVIKNRNWLIIAPIAQVQPAHILIEEPGTSVSFAGIELKLRLLPSAPAEIRSSKNIASLDAGAIRFPLLLRRWKPGDYFYPLGMKKKKKLARFFIDNKLSTTEKENIWVLEMDGKIIWVIGYRIDDRFKVTASTRKVLEITAGQERT